MARPSTQWLASLFLLSAVISSAPYASAADAPDRQETLALIQTHYQKAKLRDGDHRAIEAAAVSARNAVDVAESVLGVKVSATAGSFITDRTEAQPSNRLESESDRQFTSSQMTVSARKPLYRRKDQLSVEQVRSRYQSAQALVEASEQRLFAKVVMAWVEVLVSRDRLLTASESERRATIVRQESERRLQAGETSADLLALEMSREIARQADVQDARVRLGIAERMLKDLAGDDAVIPEIFSLAQIMLAPINDQSEEELTVQIERDHPELRSFRHLEDAALIEREKASAERYPTVDGYITASKGENDTATYIRDERRIGVQVVVPLYTSGLIPAALAQTEAELEKSRAMTAAATTRLKTVGVNSLSRLHASRARLASSHFQLKASAVHIRSVEGAYLAGSTTRADLARAELDYLQYRQQHGDYVVQYTQSWLDLHTATSRMFSSPLLASPADSGAVIPSVQLISTTSASARRSSESCARVADDNLMGRAQCQ
jgi:outer membrane protein TolC